jgi:hypothetical protein
MYLLSLLSLMLIAMLLMTMLTRAHPWIKAHQEGKVIKTIQMSILQRIFIHRSTLLALALGITLGRVMGWLPVPLAVFAAIFAIAILLMPMHYTFTTKGVGVGQAIFRPWKDFTGIVLKPHQVVMDHPSFLGRLTLFVKPAEFDPVLVKIHHSYQ